MSGSSNGERAKGRKDCVHQCDSTWICRNFGRREGGSSSQEKSGGSDEKQTKADGDAIHAQFPPGVNKIENALSQSLVTVDFERPFSINGRDAVNYRGTGLVVDAANGIVVVDRNTVPGSLGDATVSFASSLRTRGKVVYVHPMHNIAFIQYDPTTIGSTPAKSAKLASAATIAAHQSGEPVWLCGLNSYAAGDRPADLVSRRTRVGEVGWVKLGAPSPPRYQEHAIELMSLQDSATMEGGVIASEGDDTEVVALWSSFACQTSQSGQRREAQFFRGIPADIVTEVLPDLSAGKVPQLFALGAELEPLSLATAREMGLDQKACSAIEAHAVDAKAREGGSRRSAMQVMLPWGGSAASDLLRAGDLVISVDGAPLTSFRELERYCQHKHRVTLQVLRSGEPIDLEIETVPLPPLETERIVFWMGLILQVPVQPTRRILLLSPIEPLTLNLFCLFCAHSRRHQQSLGSRASLQRGCTSPANTLAPHQVRECRCRPLRASRRSMGCLHRI
jgi:S1-C subfamily serine protease